MRPQRFIANENLRLEMLSAKHPTQQVLRYLKKKNPRRRRYPKWISPSKILPCLRMWLLPENNGEYSEVLEQKSIYGLNTNKKKIKI